MSSQNMQALTLGDRWLITRLARALLGYGFGNDAAVRSVATPKLGPSEVLVKVEAVALNPTDNLHIDLVGAPQSIVGCDYCGVVTEVGSGADSTFKVGDRIAGVVHGGMYPDKGAFASYLKVETDLAWAPPMHLTSQQASTYGVSAVTAMQALFLNLSVPWPTESKSSAQDTSTIFVYAGSAAASLFVIQLAKLAGLKVVTTCSPHNFDLVRSYGADFAYDYHSTTALEDIKNAHPDIGRAFDGLSQATSTDFCAQLVKAKKGKVVVLLDTRKVGRPHGVEVVWIMMYTLFGHPFAWLKPVGPSFPAVPSDRAALARFYKLLPDIVDVVKPLPVSDMKEGLNNIEENLKSMKAKGVSGKKLVMRF